MNDDGEDYGYEASKRRRERRANAKLAAKQRMQKALDQRRAEQTRFRNDPSGYKTPEQRAAERSARQSRAAKIRWDRAKGRPTEE